MSWWSLGQSSGYDGSELGLWRIACAFCEEKRNWEIVTRVKKKKPNERQELYFDTYKYGNCAGYVMVLWSSGDRLHDYKVLPWSLSRNKYPEHWPNDIGRYWLQAKRNLDGENWDAAAMMAASALQLAFRSMGAKGGTFHQEVKHLTKEGVLPPVMEEWANEVRWLRNDAAHPEPGQEETDPEDAKDVVRFLYQPP